MSCFLDKIDSSQAEKERAKAKPRAESRSCHEKRGRASWRWIPMAEIRAEGRKKQPLSQVTLSFLLLQYTHCLHLLVWCTWAHASIVHMAHMHTCLHCSYGTHACIAHMHTHTHTHTHTHLFPWHKGTTYMSDSVVSTRLPQFSCYNMSQVWAQGYLLKVSCNGPLSISLKLCSHVSLDTWYKVFDWCKGAYICWIFGGVVQTHDLLNEWCISVVVLYMIGLLDLDVGKMSIRKSF